MKVVEHADHFSLRHDRKKKSAVHAGIARKLHLGHARVCGNVGRPYRLLGLPRPAGQARARRVSEFARTGDKTLDRFHLHAPGFGKAQQPGLLVHAKIPPALPVLGFAYGADHRLERRGGGLRLGEPPAHRMLEREQLVCAPTLGDILCNAVIAAEAPFVVEDGLAAGADGAHIAR